MSAKKDNKEPQIESTGLAPVTPNLQEDKIPELNQKPPEENAQNDSKSMHEASTSEDTKDSETNTSQPDQQDPDTHIQKQVEQTNTESINEKPQQAGNKNENLSSSSKESVIDVNITEKPPKKSLKRLLLISIILIICGAIVALFFTGTLSFSAEFISPVPENPDVLSYETSAREQKEVIGFLPYWNMKEEENFRYHLLTQIAFFALEIDKDGNIHTLKEDGTEEPGWTAYKSQAFGTVFRKAKENGTKVILTIQAMDHDTIVSVVNDQAKRKRAIDNTLEIIELKNLDGVNIDFEYAGSPPYVTTNNFTAFVKEMRLALDENNPDLQLSVDVFADSTTKVRLWDIPKIAEHVNHIIIMAYDFHRASSKIAGPVAPIRGAPDLWQYDIIKTLTDYTNAIPAEKIILGVPYYGYEWRTTSEELYATTYPNTGALATFKRIQTIIENDSASLDWDEISLSPRITHTIEGKTFQIYYENEISLGLKYDLIQESGLAGTAIWALGYDGNRPNLWNILAEKFYADKAS